MKPEIKERWVAALRSGNYPQGQGALKTSSGGYCCLGVLCDVIDPTNWQGTPDTGYEHRGLGAAAWPAAAYLPTDISAEQQISSAHQTELARMNDNGNTFDQIADFIEREL